MATKTANRKQVAAIRLAESVANLIDQTGQPRQLSMFDLAPTVVLWAKKGESLRKRYENECSYEWADTEDYRKGTERAEKMLVGWVKELGLHAFIQGDCRGATLYVDSKPIDPSNYTSAVCVSL